MRFHTMRAGLATAVSALLVGGVAVSPATAAAAPTPMPAGTFQRVSNTPAGAAPKTGAAGGLVSGDGRYTVYSSQGTDISTRDHNGSGYDVFLYDATTKTTTLVSRTPGGASGDLSSFDPSISSNGRYISYSTYATNFPGADGVYGELIYRYDIQTGVNMLVTSVNGVAVRSQAAVSSISATGRYVAYYTDVAMLPADHNDYSDIYLYDASTGKTRLVSTGLGGATTDGDSSYPAVSADGHVAFMSTATNLTAVPHPDPYITSVYLWSPSSGASTLVSKTTSGGPGDGAAARISDDGRFVTFDSFATNLVAGDPAVLSQGQVYLYNVSRGQVRRISNQLDPSTGHGQGSSGGMSRDGRYLLYVVTFAPFDYEMLIFDRVTNQTRILGSRGSDTANDISADGHHIVVNSTSSDLAPGPDTNNANDIFLWTKS